MGSQASHNPEEAALASSEDTMQSSSLGNLVHPLSQNLNSGSAMRQFDAMSFFDTCRKSLRTVSVYLRAASLFAGLEILAER